MNYQKLYEDSKFQVHATNVTGLGATQVAASLINSICKNDISKHAEFFFPDEGLLKHYKPSKGKTKRLIRLDVKQDITKVLQKWSKKVSEK